MCHLTHLFSHTSVKLPYIIIRLYSSLKIHQITVGTLRNSLVHPREVFRAAILDSANGIIAVHNHPSGNSEPSEQDYGVTDRIVSAGEIIGITALDHIVVARDGGKSIMACRGKV